ncbi:MAG: isoprenoid biosynthesis glyoxalase ElbB [Candidatus Eisenbacteria bacterium]|nr:isoprenoid biosynthesis glyoxalase ElbB [Candidatus Eisenbacteria bacterium]
MARIGLILSGCGVMDGSEIHESVAAILALDRAGAEIVYMAPNGPQMHTINHVTGDVAGDERNILIEASRISRGPIEDVAKVAAADLDALVIPGGYGAAKNLCDFATKGADCQAQPDVARLIKEMHGSGKPIGAMCIAPALVARVLGRETDGLELTVGNDAGTAGALEKLGARHVEKGVREAHVDTKNKVVSTPAYMLAQRPSEAADGIQQLVQEVLRLA